MKNKKLAIGLLVLVVLLGIGGVIYAVYNKPDSVEKEKPAVKEPDKEPSVYTDTDFNLNFVKTVNSSQEGNYLVSPYSVEIALNMLKEGATGESEKQILSVIGERKINDVTIPKRVGVANALFIKDIYKDYVSEEFVNKLKTDYDAEVLYDKFITPNVINNWVKEKTRDMIEKVIDDISPEFVLGIADAIAIDVNWASQFECNKTTGDEFEFDNDSKKKVEMMHKKFEFNASYFETENAKGVVLPYATYDEKGEEVYGSKDGKRLEFIAILPNGKASDYVEKLTTEELKAIDENKKNVNSKLNLELALPRFSYSFDLKNFMKVLQTMGIKDVFSKDDADLSGRSKDATYIKAAKHKATISFANDGIKAAAVTVGIGSGGGGNISFDYSWEVPVEKIDLSFNKPFVYLIRDKDSGEVWFVGTVYEPIEKKK